MLTTWTLDTTLWTVVLPAWIAACLLFVRRRWSLGLYALACLPVLAGAGALWVWAPEYVYIEHDGWGGGEGFVSWSALPAVAVLTLICAAPPRRASAPIVLVIAVFAANLFLARFIACR